MTKITRESESPESASDPVAPKPMKKIFNVTWQNSDGFHKQMVLADGYMRNQQTPTFFDFFERDEDGGANIIASFAAESVQSIHL